VMSPPTGSSSVGRNVTEPGPPHVLPVHLTLVHRKRVRTKHGSRSRWAAESNWHVLKQLGAVDICLEAKRGGFAERGEGKCMQHRRAPEKERPKTGTRSTASASPAKSVRRWRNSTVALRRAAIEAWLYRPCFVRDARIFALPSSVRGPVDGPPCTRQRPFGMAAARHGVPALVVAPHRGALSQLPGRLPFLSRPRP
jgi:hypothetical protein